MARNKGGRPQTLTAKQIQNVKHDLEKYIDSNEDPTIVGFTSSYKKVKTNKGKEFHINKDYINNHDEFCELRRRAIEKQEAYLVGGSTQNKLNPTVSIFRLKQPQHGYRDKQEVEQHNTGEMKITREIKKLDE